jgi:hypothetical protein
MVDGNLAVREKKTKLNIEEYQEEIIEHNICKVP